MTNSGRAPGLNDDEEDSESPEGEAERRTGQKSSGVFRASRSVSRLSGGWTIAEQFVREGYYYRLLKRPLSASDDAARLTKREAAALELASVGYGNKSIAEQLKVSPSTVGVLLFRAATKLNVASRSDLLLAYEAWKLLGTPNVEPVRLELEPEVEPEVENDDVDDPEG
jgi:DNA-binding CsgD family transcriptional regulator